jgi:hypothetical protein
MTRVKIFLKTKRRRFLYLFLAYLFFNFIGNFFGFVAARFERSTRKFKRQWILSKNPAIMSYSSAVDTLYEPKKLSQQSFDKVCEAFLKVDRLLKDGFSRLLIIKVFEEVSVICNITCFL